MKLFFFCLSFRVDMMCLRNFFALLCVVKMSLAFLRQAETQICCLKYTQHNERCRKFLDFFSQSQSRATPFPCTIYRENEQHTACSLPPSSPFVWMKHRYLHTYSFVLHLRWLRSRISCFSLTNSATSFFMSTKYHSFIWMITWISPSRTRRSFKVQKPRFILAVQNFELSVQRNGGEGKIKA